MASRAAHLDLLLDVDDEGVDGHVDVDAGVTVDALEEVVVHRHGKRLPPAVEMVCSPTHTLGHTRPPCILQLPSLQCGLPEAHGAT